MAKDNKIYWIVGIVILALIVLPRLDTGLFAVEEVCTWDEPETIEEYQNYFGGSLDLENKRIYDIIPLFSQNSEMVVYEVDNCLQATIEDIQEFPYSSRTYTKFNILTYNSSTIYYSIWCNKNDDFGLSVRSNNVEDNIQTTNSVLDNYLLNYYTCETTYTPSAEMGEIADYYSDDYPVCSNNINKIWNIESSKLFLFLNKDCDFSGGIDVSINDYYFMEFQGVPNFCSNWYLNPEADFLDASGQEDWTIGENIKLGKTYFKVEDSGWANGYFWCHNPDLMGYASSKVLMDDFFDAFYNEDTPSCTQETKQCDDGSYVSRDPNNNCVFTPCPDEPTINGDTEEKWYNDALYTSGSGFEFKLWMLLVAFGGIILIVIMGKK